MKIITTSLERIGFKTGLFAFVLLLAYFFIMKSIGLAAVLQLRFLNFFILFCAIWYSIHTYRKSNPQISVDDFYLGGIGEGMFTAGVAVFLFSVFVGAYVEYIDPSFLKMLQSKAPMGQYLDGLMVFLVLSGEGIASAVIITFGLMQYYKKKNFSNSFSGKLEHQL